MSAAERLYARLAPYAYADAENGHALEHLATALMAPDELIETLVRDSPTHIAWGKLVDPDTCPDELLDWIAGLHGVVLPPSALTAAEKRYRIKQAAGYNRGTARATIEAVQRVLDPDTPRTVYHADFDPDRWHYTVGTVDSETPDPAAVQRAALEEKAAYMLLRVFVLTGWTWLGLYASTIAHRETVDGIDTYVPDTTYPTWQSVIEAYTTWQDVIDNTPS